MQYREILNEKYAHPTKILEDGTKIWHNKTGRIRKEQTKDEIIFYKNEKIYKVKSLKYRKIQFYKNGVKHKDGDEPALISYYKDGKIENIIWFKNGLEHREGDNPAYLWYHKNGKIKSEHWIKNGKFYREHNKPIIIDYKKDGKIESKRYTI